MEAPKIYFTNCYFVKDVLYLAGIGMVYLSYIYLVWKRNNLPEIVLNDL